MGDTIANTSDPVQHFTFAYRRSLKTYIDHGKKHGLVHDYFTHLVPQRAKAHGATEVALHAMTWRLVSLYEKERFLSSLASSYLGIQTKELLKRKKASIEVSDLSSGHGGNIFMRRFV